MTTEPTAAALPSPADADGVDLRKVLRTLSAHWLLIAVLTVVGLALASVYLHLATYRYTATLQLVPTEQAAPALSRNLSGLASLAGVGLPKGQVSQYALLLETLRGRDVAAIVARDLPVMHTVFAKEWNEDRRQWQPPGGVLDDLKAVIEPVVGVPYHPWRVPDAADLQEFLSHKIGIDEDTKKAVATISYSDRDPAFAVHLLNVLTTAADERLRRRALQRSGQYIIYLQRELQTVSVADQREALIATLSEQEKQRMTASATEPFAADPVGSASASLRPTSPTPWIVLAVGAAGGLGVGIGLAMLRDAGRRANG